jgi:hypothetical protein
VPITGRVSGGCAKVWVAGVIIVLSGIVFLLDMICYLERGYWASTRVVHLLELPAEHSYTDWVGFRDIMCDPLAWPVLFLGLIARVLMGWISMVISGDS